jgi:hypothetical protein
MNVNAGHFVVVQVPDCPVGVGSPNAADNANLRACYTNVLTEIMGVGGPPPPVWHQLGRPPPAPRAAPAAGFLILGAPPPPGPPIRVSVSFPLLGANLGWGMDNAANQALLALTIFFNAPGLVGNARKNFFGDIKLVVPYSDSLRPREVENAWITAYK